MVSDISRRDVFDSASYESLKQRVHLLKKEHQKVVKTTHEHHEVESVAVLELRHKYDATVNALKDDVASLQSQLRQNTERSAKLRLHYEKDKRALQSKVERLEKILEGKDSDQDLEMENLRSQHRVSIEAIEATIKELHQGREEDRRAFERARQEAVNEVDQWCQGEIEAVRHMMSRRVDELREETSEWERKCKQLVQDVQEVSQAKDLLEDQIQQLEESKDLVKTQLIKKKDEEKEHLRRVKEGQAQWQVQLDKLAMSHREEIQALKASHHDQLEMVDQRLQQVVSRKDSAILTLKAELKRVHDKLRMFEGLIVSSPSRKSTAQ